MPTKKEIIFLMDVDIHVNFYFQILFNIKLFPIIIIITILINIILLKVSHGQVLVKTWHPKIYHINKRNGISY